MERKLKYILINTAYDNLDKVLESAIGNPTPDKIKAVIANYKDVNHHLIGCVNDNMKLIGVVGFKKNNTTIEIFHLSVLEQFREQGIGSNLIKHISMYFSSSTLVCETDKDGVVFYHKFGFISSEIETEWGIRYQCELNKRSVEIDENATLTLNSLSSEMNKLYGYVVQAGENYGEPAINSGPCGPFAYEFALYWNTHFQNPCKIACLIQQNDECWHVLIELPNSKLFDGGVGVHDYSRYKEKGLKLVLMDSFDIELLERHAYGLERSYPRYCPDFSLGKIIGLIHKYIDRL